jgi:hypothetical protein
MATNDIYINPGTEITFQSSGGTVAMTVDNNCAAGDGVKSDACTLAASYGTARPDEYRWTCKCFWAAGAVVGETFTIYAAEANADGEYDGGVSAGDGAFTDSDGLLNMKRVGTVTCTNATEEQEYASGTVRLTSNKIVLVVWNGSVAATMHATATNFEFKLLPIPLRPQP